MMRTGTIQEVFFSTSEKCKDKTAFNYFDNGWKKLTYKEFSAHSKAVASYLMKNGIRKSDRVAIVSENRPEWCIVYIGIVTAGAIAVPIDAQLQYEAIKNILLDSDTKIVFHSSKTEENIKKAISEIQRNTKPEISSISFDSKVFIKLKADEEASDFPEIEPEDIASLIYTSGTTGTPKGVMLTHRNFCSDAEALIKAEVIGGSDNVLSLLPLHHTYPFMCTFLVPVFLGATITYAPSLKGPDIISAIKVNSVTIFIGVPHLLGMIRNGIVNKIKQLPSFVSKAILAVLKMSFTLKFKLKINPGRLIFRSVHTAMGKQFRFFASGGAKLAPEIMKDLEAIGFTVLEGYGLTETSPVVTFNPIEKRKIGSAGKPLETVSIKIIEPQSGRILGANEEGEVTIKGPMVMKGYYKNKEATEQVIKDGWFSSGDLGFLDSEGYLFITGRIKEVIVLSSGKNIYPEEIETEFLKIPLIKEICVFALQDNGQTDSLQALIVPDLDYAKKQQIGNLYEALRWEVERVSNTFPSYQRIKGFTLHQDALPRTPLGKLRRFMIRDLAKEKTKKPKVRTEDKELTADDTGRKVIKCISPLLKEEINIQGKDNLELDLGLDSLQRIELIASLENEFSVKLPDTFASEVQTVGEIVEKIKGSGVRGQGLVTPLSPPLVRGEFKGGVSSVFSQEPEDAEKKKVGLKQGRIEWLFVSFLLGVFKLLFKIFFRFDVKGKENIPGAPFIIVSNHSSYLDGFIVSAGVPLRTFRLLYFQGFQKYFKSALTSLFARLAHVIPIDPETHLNKAFQLSSYVLKNNKALCIFPEGGRSFTGELMGFKKGIGILAFENDVPVVPAFIKGSFEVLPRGARWPKFKKISLVFGKPVWPSELDLSKKPDNVDQYQFFTDELRGRVKELKAKFAAEP